MTGIVQHESVPCLLAYAGLLLKRARCNMLHEPRQVCGWQLRMAIADGNCGWQFPDGD